MERFYDDENGYLNWVAANPHGYVVNCYKRPDSAWRLHRAGCRHLQPLNFTTGDYYKVCSNDAQELVQWAERNSVGDFAPCAHCRPVT